MKKYLFYLLLFDLTFTSCKSQSIISPLPNKSKEDTLRELLFKDNLERSTEYPGGYKLLDGSEMQKSEDMDYYYFRTTLPHSPYATKYTYFKNPLQLKREYNTFYSASTGILKEYDKQGNLIKEINLDAGFGFSLQNVIGIMQADYQIDLLHLPKDQYRDLERSLATSNTPPTYTIAFDDVASKRRREVVLNGNTGELISDNLMFLVK